MTDRRRPWAGTDGALGADPTPADPGPGAPPVRPPVGGGAVLVAVALVFVVGVAVGYALALAR